MKFRIKKPLALWLFMRMHTFFTKGKGMKIASPYAFYFTWFWTFEKLRCSL